MAEEFITKERIEVLRALAGRDVQFFKSVTTLDERVDILCQTMSHLIDDVQKALQHNAEIAQILATLTAQNYNLIRRVAELERKNN